MLNHNQLWGTYGEDLSSAYLLRQGYQIIARNWRCHHHEIDLIAQNQTMLILVEVKLRLVNNFAPAVDALNWRKLKQLKRAASYALYFYHPKDWRYDFIAIDLNPRNHLARLCHYRQIL